MPRRQPNTNTLATLKTKIISAAIAVSYPGSLHAHDAFGDLGPFYANLLHPLADPLQAALLIATAALLASRSLAITQTALPLFASTASITAILVTIGKFSGFTPLILVCAATLTALATIFLSPQANRTITFVLVVLTGAMAGAAPGVPKTEALLQFLLGSILGITVSVLLLWYALETASRRFTPLVVKIAGSWIAAIGIIMIAFSL